MAVHLSHYVYVLYIGCLEFGWDGQMYLHHVILHSNHRVATLRGLFGGISGVIALLQESLLLIQLC